MQLPNMKLKLNNKSLVYMQIFFVMVMLWLRDVLHFPSAITYVTDAIMVLLVFFYLFKKSKLKILKDVSPQYIIVVLIVLFMLLGAVINCVRPLLMIWSLRNNLRFFLFFFLCVDLLDQFDVDAIIKFFKCFFGANFLMCTIQYFAFGLSADYLGGFFGTTRGCNGYLNVFLCVICAISIADFIAGKSGLGLLLLYLGASLYIAIIAELKVFYIELIIMVAFVIVMSKPSVKTIVIGVVFVLGFVLGGIALFI